MHTQNSEYTQGNEKTRDIVRETQTGREECTLCMKDLCSPSRGSEFLYSLIIVLILSNTSCVSKTYMQMHILSALKTHSLTNKSLRLCVCAQTERARVFQEIR